MKKAICVLAAMMVVVSLYGSSVLSTSELEASKATQEEKLLLELRKKDNLNLILKEKDRAGIGAVSRQRRNDEARAISDRIKKRDLELIDEYLEFLEQYPDSYVGHNDLGNLYYDIGYSESAYEHWLKSASINPGYAPAHNNIGVWHSHYGTEKMVAIREVKRAIELGPQQASYHFNLATFYYTYRPDALKHLEVDLPKLFEVILREHKYSVQLAPLDYDYAYQYAYTFFGYKLFKTRLNWKDAEEAWLNVMKIRPTEKRTVYYFLTMLAINSGNRQEAEKYMKLLKQVDPGDSPDIKRLEERLKEMQGKGPFI